jgi:hypothetical protein
MAAVREHLFQLAGSRGMSDSKIMAVTLPIQQMSREDKLMAMEMLWADLSQDENKMDSPSWHENVLRETEKLIRDGKAKFSDWNTAQRRIRAKASRGA